MRARKCTGQLTRRYPRCGAIATKSTTNSTISYTPSGIGVHLGGLAGFRDARAALAEMARVARSGTPVVVLEANPGLDAPLGILGNAARKLLPAVPDGALADLVPPSAGDVEVRRLDPLFVLLRFTAP